nr:LysR substrate-binding domain-containing protein [Pseudomonas sp. BAY1663]
MIDEVDELEASVSQSHNLVRGRVAVEMPSPVGIFLVIPALPDFAAKFPEIRLDIGCSERVVGLAEEGIDCAIRGGTLVDLDLVSRAIGQMRFCFCASPSYLATAPLLNHPGDLTQHRHLGFKFPGTGRRFIPTLTRGNESFTLDQTPYMYFNNGSAVTAAAWQVLALHTCPGPKSSINSRLVILSRFLATGIWQACLFRSFIRRPGIYRPKSAHSPIGSRY